MKRIWCYFFGHRPVRHLAGSGKLTGWTNCGRCHALMTRGYFGWEIADARAKIYYQKRLLAEKAEAVVPVVVVSDVDVDALV